MSIILNLFIDILIFLLSKLPDALMGWGVGKFLDNLISQKFSKAKAQDVTLYPPDCGDHKIDLGEQRLLVSSAFGNYFSGLLEKEKLYIDIKSQIDSPPIKGQEGINPLQRLFWLLGYSNGPRVFVFAGDGGMGKSTVAAKLVRCLFEEQAVDIILGDSAKTQHIDPDSGETLRFQPGYYDADSFYKRLCYQLGLPTLPKRQALSAIKDRIVGQKVIIIVDNLETIKKGDELLSALRLLTSRDVRAIITTREIKGLRSQLTSFALVEMMPITSTNDAMEFLDWHIEQYKIQNPNLEKLKKQLSKNNVKWVVKKTGGVPLLMQLILSDIARTSWDVAKVFPNLFGKELLDYLYKARWNDLSNIGEAGRTALRILEWIAEKQYQGKNITTKKLRKFAEEESLLPSLSDALSLLHERFMILNGDISKGDYSIFPSLSEFIEKQSFASHD